MYRSCLRSCWSARRPDQQRDGFTYNVVDHKEPGQSRLFRRACRHHPPALDDSTNYFVYSSYYTDTNGTGEKLTAGQPQPKSPATIVFSPAIFSALAEQTALGPRATALDTPEIDKEYTFHFTDIAQWRAADT